MNARIAISLSLAVFGACATDDADINTDLEEAQFAPGRVVIVDQPQVDTIGQPECGNGKLYVPVAQQVELRWLATACYGPNEINLEIEGVNVFKGTAGGGCTCIPGVRSERITDPAVLSMIGGTTALSVSAPGATLLAWAEIVIVDQAGEHTFTVFDQDGSNTAGGDEPNLCLAGSTENGAGEVQVQLGEQCDDGNRVDGDGCSSTCTKE